MKKTAKYTLPLLVPFMLMHTMPANAEEPTEVVETKSLQERLTALVNDENLTQDKITALATEVEALAEGTEKADAQKNIAEAQNIFTAEQAVNALFADDKLAEKVDEAAITAALKKVEAVTNEAQKKRLALKVEQAKKLLIEANKPTPEQIVKEAQDAVDKLFTGSALAANVELAQIAATQKLVDNVTDKKIKEELQKQIDRAQELWQFNRIAEAKVEIAKLFNAAGTALAGGISSTHITEAEKLLEGITDAATKKQLQDQIDKARGFSQDKLVVVAEQAVNALFVVDKLAPNVTKETIASAKIRVSVLADSDKKTTLLQKVAQAEAMLEAQLVAKAERTVKQLFDGDVLAKNVSHVQVREAQRLVDELADSDAKAALQASINTAKSLLPEEPPKTPLEEAREQLSELFKDVQQTILKDSVTEAQVLGVAKKIEQLPPSLGKNELVKVVNRALGIIKQQEADLHLTSQVARDLDARINAVRDIRFKEPSDLRAFENAKPGFEKAIAELAIPDEHIQDREYLEKRFKKAEQDFYSNAIRFIY